MRPITGVLIFMLCMNALSLNAQWRSKPQFRQSTGTQDRKYAADLLYKISFPVLDNLAKSQLRKNMPLEQAPGYYLPVAQVTYLEAVGRTLAGLAPWLELGPDNSREGLMRSRLQQLAIRGLQHAVDSSNPDYLNFRTEQQPIVDAAFLAHAFVRAPMQLWKPLDSTTKGRIITELKSLRNRKPGNNNWLLFGAITEAFLLDVGEQPDTSRIFNAVRQFKQWYVGDGWYSDGDLFATDYYNSYVIHPMLVDLLAILQRYDFIDQAEYDLALNRMIRFAAIQERMISPEGTFPLIGRSLPYRIGALQALAQTSLMHQLPEELSPSQVRNTLTTVMHKLFDAAGTFDAKGWLQIGLAGHQPSIADPYTSTGSLYLCTTGFLALGLPATDPFWTLPPQPWTTQKAWNGMPVQKDHKVDY